MCHFTFHSAVDIWHANIRLWFRTACQLCLASIEFRFNWIAFRLSLVLRQSCSVPVPCELSFLSIDCRVKRVSRQLRLVSSEARVKWVVPVRASRKGLVSIEPRVNWVSFQMRFVSTECQLGFVSFEFFDNWVLCRWGLVAIEFRVNWVLCQLSVCVHVCTCVRAE